VHTHLTAALFFGNNEKKHSTPSREYRVTDCHLKYDEALYRLFKILVTEFTIKYGTSPEDTDISPKNTNTSLIDLETLAVFSWMEYGSYEEADM